MQKTAIFAIQQDMKSVKIFIALLLAVASISQVEAQKRRFKGKPIEFGVTIGAANYMGDLAKLVALNETQPMGGLICRFNYSDFITLRGTAVYSRLSGRDDNYSDDAFRSRRNLSFRTPLVEFSGTIEYNIFGFGETTRATPGSPFLFAGLGVFKFNPKAQFTYNSSPDLANDNTGATTVHHPDLAKFDGQWVELQPLGTEGQETTKFNDRKRYALTQVSIPLGIGYKKQFDDFWAWGIELGVRKTFTDYIDDVSLDYVDEQIVEGNNGRLASAMRDRAAEKGYQDFDNGMSRGTSKSSDWYMFLNFTLTRKLIGGKQVCFQF
jgi:hypothetical protein